MKTRLRAPELNLAAQPPRVVATRADRRDVRGETALVEVHALLAMAHRKDRDAVAHRKQCGRPRAGRAVLKRGVAIPPAASGDLGFQPMQGESALADRAFRIPLLNQAAVEFEGVEGIDVPELEQQRVVVRWLIQAVDREAVGQDLWFGIARIAAERTGRVELPRPERIGAVDAQTRSQRAHHVADAIGPTKDVVVEPRLGSELGPPLRRVGDTRNDHACRNKAQQC